jgi:hypothetical protein
MNYINRDIINNRNYAEGRWSAVGPYYAMFPNEFAYDVISQYSKVGDKVLDPFAGRGTTLYIGGLLERHCDGIEINPVGWLYSFVKLNPARRKENVINRLYEIYELSGKYKNKAKSMPLFYHYCYCKEVLCFLLAARDNLDWKNRTIDATLMVFIILSLHDKIGNGLSNQMQLTKSMGQNYSIEWWKRNNMSKPPKIAPVALLKKKIEWRYGKGINDIKNSCIYYGDSTVILNRLINKNRKYSLLLTSPPYYSLTDYHVDQWLRLWMLGGPTESKTSDHKYKGRFTSEQEYIDLLDIVFEKTSKIMHEKSVVYVRTDARTFTKNITIQILKKHYPLHKLDIIDRPLLKRTQTSIFNNNTIKPGEVDLILTRN